MQIDNFLFFLMLNADLARIKLSCYSSFACKFEMIATKAETFRYFVGTHSSK